MGVLPVVLALLLAGTSASARPLGFETVAQGAKRSLGCQEAAYLAASHATTQSFAGLLPEERAAVLSSVDFRRSAVVAVFVAATPSYEVTIRGLQRERGVLTVASELLRRPGGGAAAVSTCNFHIVRVQKRDLGHPLPRTTVSVPWTGQHHKPPLMP